MTIDIIPLYEFFFCRVFIDWSTRSIRFRASHGFYVANTVRTGRNQFVGAFERLQGGDVGCRGQRTRSRKASLGPDQREQPDEDEEDARRREREGEGTVAWKKEERGLTDSSLKITSSANETSWARLGPGSLEVEEAKPTEKPSGIDDATSPRIVWTKDRPPRLSSPECAGVRLILSSTVCSSIFSLFLFYLLNSKHEPNCRDTGFNMPTTGTVLQLWFFSKVLFH